MQQCLQHGTVQPALQLGVAVSYAEHGLDGKSNCMELLALYCSIYAAAHWTDLRSALAQAVKHNQPARNAAGSGQQAINHKVLVCGTSCVALCMELTK
jgi:hypothetical protein